MTVWKVDGVIFKRIIGRKTPEITDEDIDFKSGEFDHMIASIARRTKRSAKDIEKEIRNWDM